MNIKYILNPFDKKTHKDFEVEWTEEKTCADYWDDLFSESNKNFRPIVGGGVTEWHYVPLKHEDVAFVADVKKGSAISGAVGVLMIALAYALSFTPAAGASPFLYMGGVGLMAGAVVGGLSQLFMPERGSDDLESTSDSYQWSGIKNQQGQGFNVPVVFGVHRAGGHIIEKYVSVINDISEYNIENPNKPVNSKERLQMLLAMSEGEVYDVSLLPSDVKFNDQLASNFEDSGAFLRLAKNNGTKTQDPITWTKEDGSIESPFSQIKKYYQMTSNAQLVGWGAANWLHGVAYKVGDVVLEKESTYRCITAHTSGDSDNVPTDARWEETAYDEAYSFPPTYSWYQYTTSEAVNALSVLFECPALCRINDKSHTKSFETWLIVQYRKHGTSIWISPIKPASSWNMEHRQAYFNATRKPFNFPWYLRFATKDTYDIRIGKINPDGDNMTKFNETFIKAITEIQDAGITYKNTALFGVGVNANNLLSGATPTVTTIVKGRKVFDVRGTTILGVAGDSAYEYNGIEAHDVAIIQNPANIIYDLLTNVRYGTGNFLTQSNIDMASLAVYADWCDEVINCNLITVDSSGSGSVETEITQKRYEINFLLDKSYKVLDLINKICGATRSIPYWAGSKIKIVVDRYQATYAQTFNMGNIIEDSFEETYASKIDVPNQMTAEYLDEDEDYDKKTMTVVDYSNVSASIPIIQRSIALIGLTNAARVKRELAFAMRKAKAHTDIIKFSASIDGIICEVGDLIRFQHDVPQYGFGGRIISVAGDVLTLDTSVPITTGINHTISVKKKATNLYYEKANVTAATGQYSTITVNAGHGITEGDLFTFGANAVHFKPYRILSILKSADHEFSIEAENYNNSIYSDDFNVKIDPAGKYSQLGLVANYTYDPATGIITFVNEIPTDSQQTPPFVTDVSLEESYELVAGSYKPMIDVSWGAISMPPNSTSFIERYEVLVSFDDGESWRTECATNGTHQYIKNVEVGDSIYVCIKPFTNLGKTNNIEQSEHKLQNNIIIIGSQLVPMNPSGLTATGKVLSILLEWINPSSDNFNYTSLWCSQGVNDRASAVEIYKTKGNRYTHPNLTIGIDYYYWIKAVDGDTPPNESPWFPLSATAGVHGTISTDPAPILDLLEESITESQLVLELQEKIDGANGAVTLFENLGNGWTIKTQENGYVSGIGLMLYEDWSDIKVYSYGATCEGPDGKFYKCIVSNSNRQPPNATYWAELANGVKSEFAILADRFEVVMPNGTGTPIVPFIVGNIGGVPGVGINGNLFIDGTAYAYAVVVGNGVNKIWLNDGGDGKLAIGGLNKETAPFRVSPEGQVTIVGAIVQSPAGATFPVPCYRGVYVISSTYYKGDIVTYGGESFMFSSSTPATGQVPMEGAYWNLYAAAGADGDAGTINIGIPSMNVGDYITGINGAPAYCYFKTDSGENAILLSDVGIYPGETVAFSVELRSSNASLLSPYFRFLDINKSVITAGATVSTSVRSSLFVRAYSTTEVPAAAVYMTCGLYSPTLSYNATAHIQKGMVSKTNYMPVYCPVAIPNKINLGFSSMNEEVISESSNGISGSYAIFANGGSEYLLLADMGLAPGMGFCFSAWAKENSGTGVNIYPYVYFFDVNLSAIAMINNQAKTGMSGGVYDRVWRSGYIPVNSVYVKVGINPTLPVNKLAYVKQGMITQGNYLTPYVPCIKDSVVSEFIFKQTITDTPPTEPTVSQLNEYVGISPNIWTDEPKGVDSVNLYEWISKRTKNATGQWSSFSIPALWSKYSFDGLSVAELYIYKRSATAITTAPAVGSYDFSTKTLSAPLTWSTSIPAGSNPVYICVGMASVNVPGATDNNIVWSTPIKGLADGSAVDMIFCRSIAIPLTPAASSSVPGGWYSNVDSVPASKYLLWSSVGTRANADANWTWQTAIQVEGEQGVANLGTPVMNGEIFKIATAAYTAFYFSSYLDTDIDLLELGIAVGDRVTYSVLVKNSTGYLNEIKCYTYLRNLSGINIGAGADIIETTSKTTEYVRVYKSFTIQPNSRYLRLGVMCSAATVENTIYGAKGMLYVGDGQQPYTPCTRDSKSIEYIFNHSSSNAAPALNTTAVQTDGYLPANWSDEPSDAYAALSASYPFQWVSSRVRNEQGQWGEFTPASLWATYATSGLSVILSNQAHTVPCDALNNVSSYLGSGGTLQVFEGSVALEASSSATSKAFYISSVSVTQGTITVGGRTYSGNTCTIANHSALTTDFAIIRYTIRVSKIDGTMSYLYIDQTITKSKTGATGEPGEPGPGYQGPGLVYRGTWNSTTAYVREPASPAAAIIRDVVLSGSIYYMCKVSHTNRAVTNTTYWEPFGASFSSVATDLLFANDVVVNKGMTFSGSAGYIKVTGSDGLRISSSGGMQVNSGGGITVNSGGGITVNSGGDIILVGAASNPAELIFKKSDSSKTVSCSFNEGSPVWTTSDVFVVDPNGNNTMCLVFGSGDGNRFSSIWLNSYDKIMFNHVSGGVRKQLDWGYGCLNTTVSNAASIGKSTSLWSEVWATDGSINTSDKTKKDSIVESDLGLDFIKQLSPKKWVWNWGSRPHYGLISQDVGDLLATRGHDFAGFIKANHKKVKGKKGEEIWLKENEVEKGQEILEEKEDFFLRYNEFIGPMIKAIQEMDAKIDLLMNIPNKK